MTDQFFHPATASTGGSTESIDYWDGSVISDGDGFFLIEKTTGRFQVFQLDDDLAVAEEAGRIIKPDSNAGDKRYKKVFDGGRVLLPSENVDQGDNSIIGTLAWHIANASGEKMTAKGLSGTHTVTTGNPSVPVTAMLEPQIGCIISVAAGQTLTIESPESINAGDYQIFAGDGDIAFTNKGAGRASWFPGADIGAKVNAAWAAGLYTVILPSGEHSFSTQILIPVDSGLYQLIGQGSGGRDDLSSTQLSYTGSTNPIKAYGSAGTAVSVGLKDFTLQGTVAAGSGILIDRCTTQSYIENVRIHDFTQNGVAGLSVTSDAGDGYTNGLNVRNVYAYNNSIGLIVESCNILSFYDCVFQSSTRSEAWIKNNYNVGFFNCIFQGCTNTSDEDIGVFVFANDRVSHGVTFHNCHIEQLACPQAVRVQSHASYTCRNVMFHGGHISVVTETEDEHVFCIYVDGNTTLASAITGGGVGLRAEVPGAGSGVGYHYYVDGADGTVARVNEVFVEYHLPTSLSVGGSGKVRQIDYTDV